MSIKVVYNNTDSIIGDIVGFDNYDERGVYVSSSYSRPRKKLTA